MQLIEIFGILLIVASVSRCKKLPVDPERTLECHRREFTFKASQTDENGRQCWDFITAMACWGRCDTGEIGDWRFPFKRSFHTTCGHGNKEIQYAILQNCDPGADRRIAEYAYYEAQSCSCVKCNSSTTSCQEVPTFSSHQSKESFPPLVTKPGRILPTKRTK